MSVTSVLFDLDGTLVDPAGSITSGIRHALVANGVTDPGEEAVEALVGPPLQIGLRTLDGVSDGNIEKIIANYRARYAEVGMAASRVYPGIRELLASLREAGIYVAVTTAKPEPIARELIRKQELDSLLDAVFGNASEHGSMGSSKTHIVQAALTAGKLDPASCIVVGDRHYDLDAARENSVASIGVSWGFALENELDVADHQVATVQELAMLLLGEEGAAQLASKMIQEGQK